MQEKDCCMKLYYAMKERKSFHFIESKQNMAMALQAMAILELYEMQIWKPILE